jgi:hypothetical protein
MKYKVSKKPAISRQQAKRKIQHEILLWGPPNLLPDEQLELFLRKQSGSNAKAISSTYAYVFNGWNFIWRPVYVLKEQCLRIGVNFSSLEDVHKINV